MEFRLQALILRRCRVFFGFLEGGRFKSRPNRLTTYGYYPSNAPNAGELHWSADGLDKRSYRAYNTRGQLTHQWGAATYPQRHVYNESGDMTALHTWRDGSLATVIDAAGTTTYGYDGAIAASESITGGLLADLLLTYPQTNGRRQSFTATLGSVNLSLMSYGYDDQGRFDEVSDSGIGSGSFTAAFGYAPHSDLPGTTVSRAGANIQLTGTRGYDNVGRLTSVGYTRPGNSAVTSHGYTLDAADRRTRADREDGTAWSYGYNDRDEVTSAVKLLPGEELLAGWQQTFDYDNLGNRKSILEGGNASGANRRQLDYTANVLNQYTAITHPGAFDVLGRAPATVTVSVNSEPVTRQGEFWRREMADLPNSLAAVWQSVQVDALDPGAGPEGADVPARRSGHRFIPMAVEAPAYDLDGNLLSEARWTYQWDAENRLVEVSTGPAALAAGVPAERYRYVYDSRSRRIARTVERWNIETSAWVVAKNERFVYDQWNVVAVVDAAGAVVQRYAWGNDLSGTPQGAGGVGGLLAAADLASGRSWCYAYDGNGNVSAVVDLADGTKVGRYEYDAFGRTIATWGDEALAEVNEYRFSTKPMEGTGLYYYGFRYYMPETGRWLNKDPIGERGRMNLCDFVKNNAPNMVDILGREGYNPLTSQGFKDPKSNDPIGNQMSNAYRSKIYSRIAKYKNFYEAIKMDIAVDRLFSRGMPNANYLNLGDDFYGRYDMFSNSISLNTGAPSFDESTFLHEMFHFYDTSLAHGTRDDEGAAYTLQHYYTIGERWNSMIDQYLKKFLKGSGSCESLAKRLKFNWSGFWDITGTPEKIPVEWGPKLWRSEGSANSSDVARVESLLGARISCKSLSDYVNGILAPHCPCLRVVCDESVSSPNNLPTMDIPSGQILIDFR